MAKTETTVSNLKINKLTKQQFEGITPSDTELYLITDDIGITSSDVTTALGYTPYNSSNPNGYTSNTGTVTSVNNTSPDANGNVSLSISAQTDIQINGTSIINNDVANIITNSAYDASSNKIATMGDIPSVPTNYVTTNTQQDITGVKTFVGAKRIKFKQQGNTDSIGFTCYNQAGRETAYFEYNNKTSERINGIPTLVLGNYATSSNGGATYLGFANSGQGGAYHLVAPLTRDASTPFSLTGSYKHFYMPLGFTDGTTTVLTAQTGMVDLSGLSFLNSSDIASSVSSSSTNSQAVGAKLFYDTVGDIETALNTINSGVSS